MTREMTRGQTTFAGKKIRALAVKTPWHRFALAAILLLSTFLNLFRITQKGYVNPYYAAGVKSMLTSWSNFKGEGDHRRPGPGRFSTAAREARSDEPDRKGMRSFASGRA